MHLKNFLAILIVGVLVGHSNAESCVVCRSDTDPSCAQKPSMYFAKTCQTPEAKGCYTRIVDGITLRGCIDELDQEVSDKCNNSNNCEICRNLNDNSGCNNLVYPSFRLNCHICSTPLGNLNCSQAIQTNPVPCKTFDNEDQCYIRKTGKTIVRGCLSDSGKDCSNQSHCYFCKGNGCNGDDSKSGYIPTAPSSASSLKSLMPFVVLIISLIIKF